MKAYRVWSFVVAAAVLATAFCSSTAMAQSPGQAGPGGDYKKASSLVALPDYLPGLGTLYVVPSTPPAGPFLAYDRSGKLISTIYMIPVKDIEAHKKCDDLNVAEDKPVDHVSMYYNAGHPGVAEPHYHIVLWYIRQSQEASLK